jgi:hypothetical protein
MTKREWFCRTVYLKNERISASVTYLSKSWDQTRHERNAHWPTNERAEYPEQNRDIKKNILT